MTKEDKKIPLTPVERKRIADLDAADKARLLKEERDALLNKTQNTAKKSVSSYHQPNPQSINYTTLEHIAKKAIDEIKASTRIGIQKAKQTNKPIIRKDPTTGKDLEVVDVHFHVKLEGFQIKGQELIDRFGFNPKAVRGNEIINAYQLAVLKQFITEELVAHPGITYGTSGWSAEFEKSINELYAEKDMHVVYHAFYPIIPGSPDTETKAKLELWQGLINTMFSWGFYHQEAMESHMLSKKVEHDRQKISEKVDEFNKTLEELEKQSTDESK